MKDDLYECKKCGAQYNQEEAEMVNFECCDEEVNNSDSEESSGETSFNDEEII